MKFFNYLSKNEIDFFLDIWHFCHWPIINDVPPSVWGSLDLAREVTDLIIANYYIGGYFSNGVSSKNNIVAAAGQDQL